MDGMGLEAADYGMIAGEVFAFSRFLRHQNPLQKQDKQLFNNLRNLWFLLIQNPALWLVRFKINQK